jgi:3-oxoacyl-[acyl-carrier protein] reductase
MRHPDAGHRLEHRAGEVLRAAGATGHVQQAARQIGSLPLITSTLGGTAGTTTIGDEAPSAMQHAPTIRNRRGAARQPRPAPRRLPSAPGDLAAHQERPAMAMYPELAGRVVVVTGAAQGIGAVALGCDVTDPHSVEAMIGRVVSACGGLDVLVTCAGGYRRLASVEDLPVDEWDHTIALNLRSVYLCCKLAIPHLKRSKAGRIINVASISGRTVFGSSSPAYGSAKAAVIQLTRFLAAELGPHGITANSIAPITTLTERVAALRTAEDLARIASQVPLRRLADPLDHARAMLFLASDAASYLNGVSLDVNGGRVMM